MTSTAEEKKELETPRVSLKDLTLPEFELRLAKLEFFRQVAPAGEYIRGVKWTYQHATNHTLVSLVCGPGYCSSYRLADSWTDEEHKGDKIFSCKSDHPWTWWRVHLVPIRYEVAVVTWSAGGSVSSSSSPRTPTIKCMEHQSLVQIITHLETWFKPILVK